MAVRKAKSTNPLSIVNLAKRADKTYDEFVTYLRSLGYDGSLNRSTVLEPLYAGTVLNSLGAMA